jgi:hypothetical protein
MAGGEQTIMEALTAELLGDVGLLHDKVKDLNTALPEAAQVIRDAGRDAADSIHVAVGKAVSELNHVVASSDAVKMQTHFDQVAQVLLAEIRKGASSVAAGGQVHPGKNGRKTIVLVAIAAAVAGMLIGGFAGSRSSQAIPNEQTTRQMEAGRDFLQLLPQLDKSTKAKLVRMIEKNREAGGS